MVAIREIGEEKMKDLHYFHGKVIGCLALVVSLGLLAGTAFAQETQEKAKDTKDWRKKPTLTFKFGSFFPSTNRTLRIDGEGGRGTEFNLGNNLGFGKSPAVLQANADIRILSWFGVEVFYHGMKGSATHTLTETIVIGDQTFNIDETLSSKLSSTQLTANLKFFLLHRQRFDLGVWVGANVLLLDMSFTAQGNVDKSVAKKPWAPVPAFGPVFTYTVLPRMYLYGKIGFFSYNSEGIDVNSTVWDLNLDYYFWKSFGVGATYIYNNFKLDLAKSSYTGKIDGRTSGFQVFALLGF